MCFGDEGIAGRVPEPLEPVKLKPKPVDDEFPGRPSMLDYDLAAGISMILFPNAEDVTAERIAKLKPVAEKIHEGRVRREAELHAMLRKLGQQVERMRYQLTKLNNAHYRTKQNLKQKVKDCDGLKHYLREINGVPQEQIISILKGEK